MSKITFRADDELVERLDDFEASKSQVMREALRTYLDGAESERGVGSPAGAPGTSDSADAARTAGVSSAAADDGPSGEADESTPLEDALAARIDALVDARVEAALDRRLGEAGRAAPARPFGAPGTPSVNLTVNVDGAGGVEVERDDGAAADASRPVGSAGSAGAAGSTGSDATRPAGADAERDRGTEPTGAAAGSEPDAEDPVEGDGTSCPQCGESVSTDHVYCPNCGGKTANRLFCECGDELRSDWGFCPGCGRRTPAADVLDRR